MALRRKNIAFIEAYTAKGQKSYLNGAESARTAGYHAKNPATIGSILLKRPEISRQVDSILQKQKDAVAMLSDISKDELIGICRASMENVPDGHANKPRYMEILSKLRGWYVDVVNNSLVVFDNSTNDANERTLKSRMENIYKSIKSKTSANPQA